MTLVARPFQRQPNEVAELVEAVIGDESAWAVAFTRTSSSVCRLGSSKLPPLDQMIWGHVFTDDVELRWREDAGTVMAVAVGDLPAGCPPGAAEELSLDRTGEMDLPLLGYYDGTAWTGQALRPGALGYHVPDLQPEEHDVLVVKADVLVDEDRQPAYHQYRSLKLWKPT